MSNELVENKFKYIKKQRFLGLWDYTSYVDFLVRYDNIYKFINISLFIEMLKEYDDFSKIMIENDDFVCFIKQDEKSCYIFSYVLVGNINDDLDDFLFVNKIDSSWNIYVIVDNNSELDLDGSLFEVVEYDLEKCLSLLSVNSNVRDRFLSIENKYMNKIKNLNNMTVSDLIDVYYDDFNENLIEYICESQSIFKKEDNEILKNKLKLFFNNKTKSINYFKLLYTHKLVNNHTKELLDVKIDFMDLSFSVLPLYKLVEITLYDLIKLKYSNDYIVTSDNKKYRICEVDKHKMMLNVMKIFLVKKGFLKNDTFLFNCITNLEKWIKEDRNGYVHKDIMNVEDYKVIDINSINLFCMIIYNL